MKNRFDSDFANFRLLTNLKEAFPKAKNSQPTEMYSIVLVTEGMIDLLVDGILIPLDSNQMTFLTPSKMVEVVEDLGKVKVLQFDQAFYCIRENDHEVSCEGVLYFGALGIPRVDLKNQKQIDSFNRLIAILEEEFEITDSIQEEMLRVILKKWLIKSVRIAKTQQKYFGKHEIKAELYRQFNLVLEKNYRKYHKVSDYAKLLNKSPKTIANQFKILGQESPSKLIQHRIILEAKRYLIHSDLLIKEIAFHLGFEDASAFSNYFFNRAGITPSRFREIYFKR